MNSRDLFEKFEQLASYRQKHTNSQDNLDQKIHAPLVKARGHMFYIVLVGGCLAWLYTSPVDAAMRCKELTGARVILCRSNEDADILVKCCVMR